MDLCSYCRGTGIKPESMQAELFDRTLGRFCSCPIGHSKWQNVLLCLSTSETDGTRRPTASNKMAARPYSGWIKMD